MSQEYIDHLKFLDIMEGMDDLSPEELEEIKKIVAISEKDPEAPPEEDVEAQKAEALAQAQALKEKWEKAAAENDGPSDVRTLLGEMTLPEKIKAALFGDGVVRGLLISSSNRLIQVAVLKNPQLRDGEIELIAKNPNVSEFVLRSIAETRTWMKSYAVKYNFT